MAVGRTRERAFTLIEMAVIVIIIGVLLATFLPRMLSSTQKDAVKKTRVHLIEARDEIIGTAIMDTSDPDPAQRYRLPTPSGSGAEVPANIVRRTDAWGNEFHYIVDMDSTATYYLNSTDCSAAGGLITGTNLSLWKDDGSGPVQIANNLAFILMSNGTTTFTKQYTDNSGAGTVDYRITVYPHGYTGPPPTQYDDMVEFVTLGYLQGKLPQ